jgi:hypothetical protein
MVVRIGDKRKAPGIKAMLQQVEIQLDPEI